MRTQGEHNPAAEVGMITGQFGERARRLFLQLPLGRTRPVVRIIALAAALMFGGTPARTQTVTTVAGNGAASFSGDGGQATSAALNHPRGVAFDASGNMYIADELNHRIRRVTPGGVITT